MNLRAGNDCGGERKNALCNFFLDPVEMSELFANVFHSYVIHPVKELGHGSLPGTSDLIKLT